jgi:hypothetical protein
MMFVKQCCHIPPHLQLVQRLHLIAQGSQQKSPQGPMPAAAQLEDFGIPW